MHLLRLSSKTPSKIWKEKNAEHEKDWQNHIASIILNSEILSPSYENKELKKGYGC